jgi:hypothetical protein
MADRRTWPYGNRDPVLNRDAPGPVYYTGPDGYHRSDRDVAGPLRMGTTANVGPKGPAVRADRSWESDFGMDRIDPTAGHDINKGTSQPPPPYKSDLIARVERGGRSRS